MVASTRCYLQRSIEGSFIARWSLWRSFQGHLRFLDFKNFEILKVNMEAFCIMLLNYIWLWVNKNAERGQTYKSVKLIIRFWTVQTTNQTRSYRNAKQNQHFFLGKSSKSRHQFLKKFHIPQNFSSKTINRTIKLFSIKLVHF